MDNNTSYIENITDLCRNLKLGGMRLDLTGYLRMRTMAAGRTSGSLPDSCRRRTSTAPRLASGLS